MAGRCLHPPDLPGQARSRRRARGRRAAFRQFPDRNVPGRRNECEAGQAAIQSLTVNLDADLIRQQPEERFKEAKAAVDLTKRADRLRGARDQEKNIEIVKKLASALSRTVRLAPDLRQRMAADGSPDRVVGSDRRAEALPGGRHFRRDQHIVGMKGARTIVAIKKTPKRRSSRSPITASSATCSRSCRR